VQVAVQQMAVRLSQPEVEGQVPLNLSVAPDVETVSDAELGVKLFPNQPPEVAAAMWVEFVTNAKLCINHYNKKNQVNFVYKHLRGNGLFFVGEQDGSEYYHLNFHAQDKSGHSQLFFGEIEARGNPKEENALAVPQFRLLMQVCYLLLCYYPQLIHEYLAIGTMDQSSLVMVVDVLFDYRWEKHPNN
jgi:hypothetical protein